MPKRNQSQIEFFFFSSVIEFFTTMQRNFIGDINPVNLLGHSAKRKLSEVVGQQGG